MLIFYIIKFHVVDIEYPQGICSPIFVVHDFSGLFLHPCTFLIKVSRSAQMNRPCLIGFSVLIKL